MHLTPEGHFVLLIIYLGAYLGIGVLSGLVTAGAIWYRPRGKRFAIRWGIRIGLAVFLILVGHHWLASAGGNLF